MRYRTPRCRPIPQEALEIIADVLLASSPRDRKTPTFDEHQLLRKTRRASNVEISFGLATAEARLFEQEDDIVPARLTTRQQLVQSLHDDGYSASEIADALGITRPTVMRMMRNSAEEIARTRTEVRGLREVYRSEVRRTGYRKPDHCAEEPCRRLGYCKYAHSRP